MNMNVMPMRDREKHDKLLETRKEYKALYLGINTNINCFYDFCPSQKAQRWVDDINDISKPNLGIYLGKIIFKKEKNKLIPEYIPTSIENLEQELSKINALWLDELNVNYIKPKYQDMIPSSHYILNSPNNLKIKCKIEKDTLVLNKEQAFSYISELHTYNVKNIKEYIEQIHKDFGIKPYVFNDELYEELGKLGIISQRQVQGFKENRLIKRNELQLIMLDYLAKQNKKDEDYLITFDDEYFYAYLVWSLKDFIIKLSFGMLQNELQLLFNPAVYIKVKEADFSDLDEVLRKKYEKQLKDIGLFPFGYDYYGFPLYYKGFFEMSANDYFAYDVDKESDYYYSYKSPNSSGPSTLGKYYFQLSYQKEIYIELLQKYYPSMTNPPQGWNQKMMKRLEIYEMR